MPRNSIQGSPYSDGEILLQVKKFLDLLIELFIGQSVEAIYFQTYVRNYNSLFAVTSLEVLYDKNLCKEIVINETVVIILSRTNTPFYQ